MGAGGSVGPETGPGAGTPAEAAAWIRGLALALGFDAVGFADARPGRDTERLRAWLARGYAGEMAWLERRVEERVDPRRVLPGARTAIVVALVYEEGQEDPEETKGAPTRAGVSCYARGEDYHRVVGERLKALETAIAARAGGEVGFRSYVDTGPVLERALAARAGLGWVGKNTCIIDPRLGSYFFLGVVLTDMEIAPDLPQTDHCGSCRACLEACPTAAFPEPYVLDATRCLSYTTIELRGAIPEELRAGQETRVFGCDVCQEVCPWNRRPRRSTRADPLGLRTRMAARDPWIRPTLEWILALDEPAWQEATQRSALRRTRHRGLLRNALVAAGNSADPALIPAVRRHAEGGDPLLAEHARWALARLAAAQVTRSAARRATAAGAGGPSTRSS